ncbi:hypothetical protein NWP96_03555 [Mycoplasmopsis cynos]|nr:hypothetical protein [Mycoplasmopsis cynos]
MTAKITPTSTNVPTNSYEKLKIVPPSLFENVYVQCEPRTLAKSVS